MPSGIVNSALGTAESTLGRAQGAIGDALGNKTLKDLGDSYVKSGEERTTQSSGTAAAGPFSATSKGGVAKENSDRTEGSWNSTVGEGKEKVGNFVGSDSLRKSGVEQNAQGVGQKAAGQFKDTAQGLGESIQGNVGGAAAGLVGNNVEKEKLYRKAEDGKARLAGVHNDVKQ